MSEPLTEQQAREVAQLYLNVTSISKGVPPGTLGQSYPVFEPQAQSAAFHEIGVTAADGSKSGYILVRATRDRQPIVEFCENKPPRAARLAQRAGTDQVKVVRYGVGYSVAESKEGKLLAELGARPFLQPAAPTARLSGEVGRDSAGRQSETLTGAHTDPLPIPDQQATYETFRTSVAQRRMRQRPPIPLGAAAATSAATTATDPELDQYWRLLSLALRMTLDQLKKAVTVEYFEVPGSAERPYYQQLDAHERPNNHDYSSGCGPTAWMNLFGWHDQMWTPNLLPGNTRYDTSTTQNMTLALHDWIGTKKFPGTSQGFTWPDDMARGFYFPLRFLGYDCGYQGAWDNDSFFVDSDKIFRVVRNAIVRDKRPCIVGHDTGYFSRHYGIGYALRDAVLNGTRMWQQVRIYPCWGDDDEDYYVGAGDTFAAYYVSTFYSRPWEIKVTTGSRDSAGTNANVFLRAFGNGGWTSEVELDTANRNDFERGQTDTFLVGFGTPVGSVPALDKINIRHDNSGSKPGWFLDRVQIRHMMSGHVWRFNCNRWFAKDEDDRRISRELTNPELLTAYKIRVTTANEANAGTDANVYIRLVVNGQQRSVEARLDRARIDDFERASICVFTVPLADLGTTLTSIGVRHDNSGNKPGWKPASIEVFDPIRRLFWRADCDRWFNVGAGFSATFPLRPVNTLIGISDW